MLALFEIESPAVRATIDNLPALNGTWKTFEKRKKRFCFLCQKKVVFEKNSRRVFPLENGKKNKLNWSKADENGNRSFFLFDWRNRFSKFFSRRSFWSQKNNGENRGFSQVKRLNENKIIWLNKKTKNRSLRLQFARETKFLGQYFLES